MVGFDVGHDCHHRLQMQERGVTFIRFSDQITAVTQARVYARGFDQAAVDEGRIEARFSINAGDHRRGGGFTVGSGNGDAVTKTHQLGQHLCTADHRDTCFVCSNNFRVVGRDGAGNDHHAGIKDVFRAMVKIDSRTERRQLLRNRVRRQIGTADLVAFIRQHFGNTAHTGAADANKMNVPDATHLGHD